MMHAFWILTMADDLLVLDASFFFFFFFFFVAAFAEPLPDLGHGIFMSYGVG